MGIQTILGNMYAPPPAARVLLAIFPSVLYLSELFLNRFSLSLQALNPDLGSLASESSRKLRSSPELVLPDAV